MCRAYIVICNWEAKWREKWLVRILVNTRCVLSSGILCRWFNWYLRRCWPSRNLLIVFQNSQTLANAWGFDHGGSNWLFIFLCHHGLSHLRLLVFDGCLRPWYLCLLGFNFSSLLSIYLGVKSTCWTVPLWAAVDRRVSVDELLSLTEDLDKWLGAADCAFFSFLQIILCLHFLIYS